MVTVAPRTGAWIETAAVDVGAGRRMGRAPYGRVD